MFCDFHHHLLYGVDDGPSTFEQTKRMLLAAWTARVDTIVATAHITPGYRPFPAAAYGDHLKEARLWCANEGIGIDILPGAEILYTPETPRMLSEGLVPTIACTRTVLIEFLPETSFQNMLRAVRDVTNAGFKPVIAHVERYQALRNRRDMAALHNLYRVTTQINTNTLLTKNSFFTARWVRWVMEEGLIDIAATDAHNTGSRPCRMKEGFDMITRAYGQETALRLCDTAPRACLQA